MTGPGPRDTPWDGSEPSQGAAEVTFTVTRPCSVCGAAVRMPVGDADELAEAERQLGGRATVLCRDHRVGGRPEAQTLEVPKRAFRARLELWEMGPDVRCEACGGKGVRMIPDPDPARPDGEVALEPQCPGCDGRGYTRTDRPVAHFEVKGLGDTVAAFVNGVGDEFSRKMAEVLRWADAEETGQRPGTGD